MTKARGGRDADTGRTSRGKGADGTRRLLFESFLLGAGLSADAFTVSLANGLRNPHMTRRQMCAVSGVYAFFQALMPMAGRGAIRFAASRLRVLRRWLPWAGALTLLALGADMIRRPSNAAPPPLDVPTLLLQGFATSVDALAAGFAIADRALVPALISSGVIAAVTFADCLASLEIGKRFGMRFARRASVCGGAILILIGAASALRALR